MNVFVKQNGLVVRQKLDTTQNIRDQILWIDLFEPSSLEVDYIANAYNLDIPTKEEREEIEESARYWEDSGSITINTYFLVRTEQSLVNETITFILHKNILFTIRYSELKV